LNQREALGDLIGSVRPCMRPPFLSVSNATRLNGSFILDMEDPLSRMALDPERKGGRMHALTLPIRSSDVMLKYPQLPPCGSSRKEQQPASRIRDQFPSPCRQGQPHHHTYPPSPKPSNPSVPITLNPIRSLSSPHLAVRANHTSPWWEWQHAPVSHGHNIHLTVQLHTSNLRHLCTHTQTPIPHVVFC